MSDALTLVLRYVVAALFAKLATRGWLSTDAVAQLLDPTVTILIGTLGWLAMLAWGLWKNTLRQKIKDILMHRSVSTVHVDPNLAAKLQMPDVVATPPAQP